MVTFKMIYKTDQEIRYEYYPENDKSSMPGEIKMDVSTGDIELVKPAQLDYECIITMEELESMYEAINELRKEEGREQLSDEEFPLETENITYFQYASHAMSRLSEAYKEGQAFGDGQVVWY